MAGSIVAAAQRIVDQLEAGGVPAELDPAAAAARRPCVLVAPPALDYSALATTWRLVLLAGHDHAGLAALEQLDELLVDVVELVHAEAADRASYPLTPDTGPVPAYVVRIVT